MLRATLKSLLGRKVRLVLSGLAVVLGVMAVSGALIVTDTVGEGFDSLFRTVNADLDVQVTGPQRVGTGDQRDQAEPFYEPVADSVVSEVAAVPDVAKATGIVLVDGARAVGSDGKVITSNGPPRFGASWRGDDKLIELRQGSGPRSADEVAINAGLAEKGNFKVGDRIGVVTLEPKRTFTLVGIFGYSGNRDSLRGETRIAFDPTTAQQLLLGKVQLYSAIDVTAASGVSPTQLRDDIKAALGAEYTVRTGQEVADAQAAQTSQFLGFLRNFLLGFAFVTLFVGMFLILNTFSILVAQRTQELGLFRALGASRGQVIRSVLIEAFVVGLIASTLGLVAGVGVAALLRQVLQAQTGAQLPGGLAVPPSAIVVSYVVGLVVTMLAALVPAVRASRTPPIAAMRDAATTERPLGKRAILGAVPTLLGAFLVGMALFGSLGDGTMPALLIGVLLSFVGVAVLMALIARPVSSALGRAFSWSVPGDLGRRNSARNPRRTAITAAALMIGVALVSGVSVLASSVKSSMQQLVQQDLAAQIVIAGEFQGQSTPTYDPKVIDTIRQMPEVQQAVAVYADAAEIDGTFTEVAAGDVGAMVQIFKLERTAGELRTLRQGEIAIGDDFAKDRNLAVGNTVRIATPRGEPATLTVVGVYKAVNILPGPVMSVRDAEARFRWPRAAFGYVAVKDGADTNVVLARAEALLKDNPEMGVQDQSSFVKQREDQVDSFVAFLYMLLGLALIVAVMGIVNTLALSILERTRELGLVRALGMSRPQVRRMITVESIVISLFGGLLGLLVGAGLGAAVARALSDEFIPVLSIPWQRMLFFLLPTLIAGLLAAIIPAIRAARTDVLRAIAYE